MIRGQPVGVGKVGLNIKIGDFRIPPHLVEGSVEDRRNPEINPVTFGHVQGPCTGRRVDCEVIGTDTGRPEFTAIMLNGDPHTVGGCIIIPLQQHKLHRGGYRHLPGKGRPPDPQRIQQW